MKILFRTWAIPAVLVLALIVPVIYTGTIEPVSERSGKNAGRFVERATAVLGFASFR